MAARRALRVARVTVAVRLEVLEERHDVLHREIPEVEIDDRPPRRAARNGGAGRCCRGSCAPCGGCAANLGQVIPEEPRRARARRSDCVVLRCLLGRDRVEQRAAVLGEPLARLGATGSSKAGSTRWRRWRRGPWMSRGTAAWPGRRPRRDTSAGGHARRGVAKIVNAGQAPRRRAHACGR